MLKFLKNREAANASWVIGEQIFQMAISFIVSILSARYLGPSNFGLMNYTASFLAFVTSIVTLGMDGVVIKKMIDREDKEGEILGSAIVFRLISSVLCGIGVILVVYCLNPGDMLVLTLISIQSIQLIFQALHVLDSWFQRHLKSKYVSLAKMIACIIVSAYKLFLLITAKDIRWFALSNTLTTMIVTGILLLAYKKNDTQPLRFSLQTGKETLGESYHFILSGLMTAIYGQLSKILLGEMVSTEMVGLFTTATTLCTMWIFVPTAIINSFRPGIMERKERNCEKAYLQSLKRLYCMIIWLCIVVSIAIFLLGGFAVKLLYGEAYAGATVPLQILIWSETFSMIGTARGIWILAEKKNKYVKYYLGMGAMLNVALNLCLIPALGIVGAAIATLVTQIFTSLIAPLFFKETRVHTKIVLQSVDIRYLLGRK